MEALFLLAAVAGIAFLADRFGEARPVHRSTAYLQALTGQIREPASPRPAVVGTDHAVESRPVTSTRAIQQPAADAT